MFRSSPPELSPTKTLSKYGANPQENKRAEARSQQSRFATLLKSHPCTNAPREPTSYPQNTSPQENTSGRLLLYVKIVLKDLNYKKLLFTTVKRNLLTLKNE